MHKTHPAADAGLVRLGAGMRHAAPLSLRAVAPRQPQAPGAQAAQRPVAGGVRVPAHVADAGRVRLGAGMRRI